VRPCPAASLPPAKRTAPAAAASYYRVLMTFRDSRSCRGIRAYAHEIANEAPGFGTIRYDDANPRDLVADLTFSNFDAAERALRSLTGHAEDYDIVVIAEGPIAVSGIPTQRPGRYVHNDDDESPPPETSACSPGGHLKFCSLAPVGIVPQVAHVIPEACLVQARCREQDVGLLTRPRSVGGRGFRPHSGSLEADGGRNNRLVLDYTIHTLWDGGSLALWPVVSAGSLLIFVFARESRVLRCLGGDVRSLDGQRLALVQPVVPPSVNIPLLAQALEWRFWMTLNGHCVGCMRKGSVSGTQHAWAGFFREVRAVSVDAEARTVEIVQVSQADPQ